MTWKSKKNFIFIFILSLIFIIYFFKQSIIGLLNKDQKLFIKKHFFPYTYISNIEKQTTEKDIQIAHDKKKINELEKSLINYEKLYNHLEFSKIELDFQKSLQDIKTKKTLVKLNEKLNLEKFQLLNGFYAGIAKLYPGSGYLDFHKQNIIVLSSRGIIGFAEVDFKENLSFKQIDNNIEDFINIKQFSKERPRDGLKSFSLKDLLISDDKIFISFTEEIKEDCWNTSLIYGDINYKKIIFTKLFSPKECVHSIENLDEEFEATQSGGRLLKLNSKNILLSIGDYRSRYLAQDTNSVNGKIVKINIETQKYEIITMGHRNPQGLHLNEERMIILETEHGPDGGDEINLIDLNKIQKNKYLNFGWPIVSAGEHYGGRKLKENEKKYKKYPLYKSHAEYGFIEPLKSFVPSIGISEITKINHNRYVVSSLKDNSIYIFKLDKNNQIQNLKRIFIGERIRDLDYYENNLFLFLEDTSSIGMLNLLNL